MRSNYDPIEIATGNGLVDEYDFDFKIEELDQLMVIVLNASGDEIQRVRGTDTTYLDNVVFDDENGGGTVVLKAVLPNNYKIFIIQANDAPTQPYKFRDKLSWTMRDIENAFDWIAGAVQRLSWLSQRGVRQHDADESDFDGQLPFPLEADRVLMIDPTGTSLVQGPTPSELAQAAADVLTIQAAVQDAEDARDQAQAAQAGAETAQGLAEAAVTDAEAAQLAAEDAQAAAETAQTAAEDAAADAQVSGFTALQFSVNQNTSTNLTGEIYSSASVIVIDYIAYIRRGTTVFSRVDWTFVFRDGAWEAIFGGERFLLGTAAACGVTFTIDSVTGQIASDVDNGAGNAIIDIKKILVAA